MSVYIECKFCGNILSLRSIECSNCDNDLIYEEINLHGEIQEGIVSPLGVSLIHYPLDEKYIAAVHNEFDKIKKRNTDISKPKNKQKNDSEFYDLTDTSKSQSALNQLTSIANKYALRGEWSWQNTGGAGYLQGVLSILIGGSGAPEKFDECAKEINELLVDCSIDSEWGWKNLSEPPHNLKVDIFAYVDDEEMAAQIDSFLNK